MILVYDSTNANDIPTTAEAVAGYVNGIYTWSLADWARFHAAFKIGICIDGNGALGDALDVERYDATPAQAPGWVKARRAAGVSRPWVYCNRSNRSAVENALIAGGVGSDQCALWVATLDGTQSVPAGPYPVAAVQYAGAGSSGGHYDLSITNQTFGPGGGSLGGEDMQPVVYRNPVDGSEWQVDWIAYTKRPINAATAAQLDKTAKAMGLPGLTIVDNANAGLDMIPTAGAPPAAVLVPHTHSTDKGTVA